MDPETERGREKQVKSQDVVHFVTKDVATSNVMSFSWRRAMFPQQGQSFNNNLFVIHPLYHK